MFETYTTDEMLITLFDRVSETGAELVAKPFGHEWDCFRWIRYDLEYDEFVDPFGCPVCRGTWIDDHDTWIIEAA